MQLQSLGQENALEKEMATHSCILAWRVPWTEEPGGLQSMGSQRVRHNRATWHQHSINDDEEDEMMIFADVNDDILCTSYCSDVLIHLSHPRTQGLLWWLNGK